MTRSSAAIRDEDVGGEDLGGMLHELALELLRPAIGISEVGAELVDVQGEALRDRIEALAIRPSVFLATLGTAADYTGRTGFAQNLFAVAGIDSQLGTPDQFGGSGASLAILCSSDSLYAEGGAAAAKALKAAGAKQLYLAGRPGDLETSLSAAGVDGFIFAGNDINETLGQVLAFLGV
jgi:methylmalonyl-CoA mutase